MNPSLQKALLEVYKLLEPNSGDTHIQFSKDKIQFTQSNNAPYEITVASNDDKFIPFLLDIDEAPIDLDYNFYVDDNENTHMQYLADTNNPNGKKLISYSKIGQRIKDQNNDSKQITRRTIENKIQRNGQRILRIASRAYQLFEIIGDFPIRKFKRITPKWLFSLTNDEFSKFLELCKKGSEDFCFAGAQT